ncbi:MAG: flippase-like domain-containing protein [Bacteroidales bacterium]|nr:flippase-like domain-containing protein [Bacteroidales bacterium]
MKKWAVNITKYTIFLAIGITLFYLVYKDYPIEEFKKAFKSINYFWIFVSITLGILSQVSRAIRWNMLIRPLGYNPKLYNSFLSVLVLYFVNLIAPRAGEVARCTVLSKYEKIPFAKLVGTVFVERMADLVTLMILAVIIILSQLSVFVRFFDVHPEMKENLLKLLSGRNIFIGVAAIALLVAAFILTRKYFRSRKEENSNSLVKRLKTLKHNFVDGIKSILKLENKWYFIGHTMFIFLMWLFMLYVIFLAYEPTKHLTIWTGMITFLMGGLAMLAPVQGGIGAWHFMVFETLFIYGIAKPEGKMFAFIAHASTNLIYLGLGLLALILLPIINRKYFPGKTKETGA